MKHTTTDGPSNATNKNPRPQDVLKCPVCEELYTNKQTLNQHLKQAHPDELAKAAEDLGENLPHQQAKEEL